MVPWSDLHGEDAAMALVSFELRLFNMAADIIRCNLVEPTPDSEAIGGVTEADILFWLDGMAEHVHGDLHHLTRGNIFHIVHKDSRVTYTCNECCVVYTHIYRCM